MDRVVAKNSRWKWLLYFTVPASFCAMVVGSITSPQGVGGTLLGCAFASIPGLWALVSAYRLLDFRSQLVIDGDGFYGRRLGGEQIPWQDIGCVRPLDLTPYPYFVSIKCVSLKLEVEGRETWLSKQKTSGLNIHPDLLTALVQKRLILERQDTLGEDSIMEMLSDLTISGNLSLEEAQRIRSHEARYEGRTVLLNWLDDLLSRDAMKEAFANRDRLTRRERWAIRSYERGNIDYFTLRLKLDRALKKISGELTKPWHSGK